MSGQQNKNGSTYEGISLVIYFIPAVVGGGEVVPGAKRDKQNTFLMNIINTINNIQKKEIQTLTNLSTSLSIIFL